MHRRVVRVPHRPALLTCTFLLLVGVTGGAGEMSASDSTGAAVAATSSPPPATLTVTPTSGLANGQSVTASGSGLGDNELGTLMECNNDPKQPTVVFGGSGNLVIPVSCSDPLNDLVSTDSTGNLASTTFTVHQGTLGPPYVGTDSAGGSSSTDAASYPCPPTSAQLAAGYSCDVMWLGGTDLDQASADITLAVH